MLTRTRRMPIDEPYIEQAPKTISIPVYRHGDASTPALPTLRTARLCPHCHKVIDDDPLE